ncbi:MAG: hypothetical protein V4592_18745 [Bacteroidota bacterium]
MKNHLKLALILLTCMVISSCAALRLPQLDKLAIGMDKNSAITAIGKKPDAVVGAKQYPGGNVEVLQYVTGVNANGRPEVSWLFFYNDKLVQFGRPTGNWQYDADAIAQNNGSK